MASKQIHRCHRCGRRLRNPNSPHAEGWIQIVREGLVKSTLCGSCTTPLERAESAVSESTLELALSGGIYMQRPKIRISS